MQFRSTDSYVASPDLALAVDAAITAQRTVGLPVRMGIATGEEPDPAPTPAEADFTDQILREANHARPQ